MRKLWIATLAAAVLCASQASAVNTRKDWDGSNYEFPFGCSGNTSVYGQTITVPKFKNQIGNFTVYFATYEGSGSMVVRGEIYQWDPVNFRATGSAVWESDPRTIAFTDSGFHRETFNANASVTPGQYVLFVTTDKDVGQCDSGYSLKWGMDASDVYSKGSLVYFNDNDDASTWTTTSWTVISNVDFAFKATMPPQ